MPRYFMVVHGSLDCLFLRQMTGSNFVLVEHHLLRDIGRPAIPVGIVAIELDSENGARADIGTAPPEAGGAHEFEANMEIRMLHGIPRDLCTDYDGSVI